MVDTYTLVATFIISLFLGSFYNVVGLRVIKEESIAFPPSHCPKCDHRLGVTDLVPVFSWVFLGGKCRYCKSKISKVYPFGEILTAISYTTLIYIYGISLELIPHLILMTVLIMATISDLEVMEVPDRFSLIGIIAIILIRVVLVMPTGNWVELAKYLGSGVVSFAVMFILLIIGGMGGADVKLYAVIGVTLGLANSGISLFYAATVASIYHLPSMLRKDKTGKTEIPFVPFITLGVLLTYIIPAQKLIELLY